MPKKVKKDVSKLVGTYAMLGVGTAVVTKAESGETNVSVLPTFASTAKLMKPVGVGIMGFHNLRLITKKRKKKQRR